MDIPKDKFIHASNYSLKELKLVLVQIRIINVLE